MFEKEAEEYKDTYFGFADERISEVQDFEGNYIDISERIMKTFIDGAEFGYNKANEWHYVKDELPEKTGRYLILNRFGERYFTTNITEYLEGAKLFSSFSMNDVYAWKEIVLPELPKESVNDRRTDF